MMNEVYIKCTTTMKSSGREKRIKTAGILTRATTAVAQL